MPPRKAASQTAPAVARGKPLSVRGRGDGSSRGRLPGVPSKPLVPDHVTTVGVKRPGYGTSGRAIKLIVNSFEITLEQNMIYHYDVIEPKSAPRVNQLLFTVLQNSEPNIFTPKIVYDGEKNAFAPRKLALGDSGGRKFSVSLTPANPNGGRPPRIYNITLNPVAGPPLNTEILSEFINRRKSHDNDVLSIITALNTAMRMSPNLAHPHNKRAFFTDNDRQAIGGGFEVWRGIFQSVRPTLGRMVLNVDLTAGIMYKEGPLIDICNEVLGKPTNASPAYLTARLPPRDRHRLQRFLVGIRIIVNATTGAKPRRISDLSNLGADAIMFKTRDGNTTSVAAYFRQATNRPLQFPAGLCVMVGIAAIPIESCFVVKGQLPPKGQHMEDDQKRAMLEFSTIKPPERLQRIKDGLKNVQEGHSDYVSQFGMKVNPIPLHIPGRVLATPDLKYGKAQSVKPANGFWYMNGKTFVEPGTIDAWGIAIFEMERLFRPDVHKTVVADFLKACKFAGVKVTIETPHIKYMNPQGDVEAQLRQFGAECQQRIKALPNLIVAILPNSAAEIYRAVKHFGDIKTGVATQCLKSRNCTRARDVFWNNVVLKINGKIGGTNLRLSSPTFSDPNNFTIVLGADVMHPAPGVLDRPSFTALVGSTDLYASKYVATASAQEPRQEIISDLKKMCIEIISRSSSLKTIKRLIFYRDGVSEGQFQHVKDRELPLIREACDELGIKPKITLIVVGKRHHNQSFTADSKDADKSQNIPAGTIIDTDITHPTDLDFFLVSHGGILGTSRGGHYSVLHDENETDVDGLQQMSFSLCHVYAPAMRSVSIPAPVYYADRVCSRAKTHFDPKDVTAGLNSSDTGTQASGSGTNLELFKSAFKPIHNSQKARTYFN